MKRLTFLLLACLTALALTACGAEKPQEISLFAMDTYMTLAAYGDSADEALTAASREINRLEHTGVAPSPALTAFLTEHGTADAPDGCSLLALLKRPQLHYDELAPFDPSRPTLTADIAEEIEISVKYEGYIKRQLQQVAEFKRVEGHKLPPDLDYNAIQGLRLEAREKLSALRPLNVGQACLLYTSDAADD